MKYFKLLYKHLYKVYKVFSNLLFSIFIFGNFRIYLNNHLTIGLKYLKKKNILFPHPIGIVIGQKVSLGENCVIYQNVTIGAKDTKNYKVAGYPKIGKSVTIYPNSIVVGDITIGDNAIIGAGSVVFNNVDSDTIVAGNPAKKIK